jgi:hypothetical protein
MGSLARVSRNRTVSRLERVRLAALPIRVPFHSIIGNRGVDDGPESSDGVVSYRSAHLEGAESEKIVPAGHNLLFNAATITEIKRILAG